MIGVKAKANPLWRWIRFVFTFSRLFFGFTVTAVRYTIVVSGCAAYNESFMFQFFTINSRTTFTPTDSSFASDFSHSNGHYCHGKYSSFPCDHWILLSFWRQTFADNNPCLSDHYYYDGSCTISFCHYYILLTFRSSLCRPIFFNPLLCALIFWSVEKLRQWTSLTLNLFSNPYHLTIDSFRLLAFFSKECFQ